MTTAIPAIDEATKMLILANGVLAEMAAEREKLLIAGDLAKVAELDADIDRATAHARRCADRVDLLERQAKRLETARQAKELRSLVARIEGKLSKRDQLAAELEKQIAETVKTFHQLAELGTEVQAAWPNCQVTDASEAICTGPSLQRAVAAELFRISGVEFVGGGHVHRGAPAFPGATPLSALTPSRSAIEPLAVRMAAASAFASRQMRQVLPQQEWQSS